jgi:hypothetical protein
VGSKLGVMSASVMNITLSTGRPEFSLKDVRKAPLVMAMRILEMSSSLVMLLLILTVYITLTLASIIRPCPVTTVPMTELAASPSASDMLLFIAVEKEGVDTSDSDRPLNVCK